MLFRPFSLLKMISVVVLTKDESLDIPACLDSLSWCDDIFVVDSGSSDDTCLLAKKAGANVLFNPFLSFAQQRNWSLDNCPFKHDWVLFLDADERSTPKFSRDIRQAVMSADSSVAGYYCCSKTILEGRWLKRCDNYPKWQFRLLRHGKARFVDFGHGQKEGPIDGIVHYIEEPYLHFAFSRGWSYWVSKHQAYAKRDARALLSTPFDPSYLFSRHSSKRNVALKQLVRVLPFWPMLRFLYTYVLRGGFLEGHQGWEYCSRMMWYESCVRRELICAKRLS